MKWIRPFSVAVSVLVIMGCSDKNPVSSVSEGEMAAPRAKLTVSSNEVAGECEVPDCWPGFGRRDSVVVLESPRDEMAVVDSVEEQAVKKAISWFQDSFNGRDRLSLSVEVDFEYLYIQYCGHFL